MVPEKVQLNDGDRSFSHRLLSEDNILSQSSEQSEGKFFLHVIMRATVFFEFQEIEHAKREDSIEL